MAGMKWVGPPITADLDAAYESYVESIKGADLTTAQIDAAITSALSSFATRTYTDTQDALNATTAYVDAQDNLRVKTAIKDQVNGVAGLDANGKVFTSRINLPSTQRYNRGPWSPAGYNGADIPLPAETTLYTVNVTDPGYPYKLVVFGTADGHTYTDTDAPVVGVRTGSATGELIAFGLGASDSMENAFQGDDFERADTSGADGILGPLWTLKYSDGSGSMGIGGGKVGWYDAGNAPRSVKAQATGANIKYSSSDYQKITGMVGDSAGESQAQPNQHVRLYGRANDAFTTYVGIEQTLSQARWFYSANGVETFLTDYFTSNLVLNAPSALVCGSPSAPRTYQYLVNNVVVGSFPDTSAVTAMGAAYRGWGFGMFAATRNFGQSTPANFQSMSIADNLRNDAPINFMPLNLSTQTAKTGATTLYVRGSRLSTSTPVIGAFRPNIHVMAVPA